MSKTPTQAEKNELLSFLPRLYAEGFRPTTDAPWTTQEDDVVQILGPTYQPTVIAFVDAAGKECWRDHDYSPGDVGAFIKVPDSIETASLAQLKTVLTFCIRGERFCDGHWAAMISDGTVRRVLERLAEIS